MRGKRQLNEEGELSTLELAWNGPAPLDWGEKGIHSRYYVFQRPKSRWIMHKLFDTLR